MQRSRTVNTVLLSLTVAAPSALADDLSPPSSRGEPGSTFQHWGFHNPGSGPPDAGVNNPYGSPFFTPHANAQWEPLDASGQRTGVYFINFDWDLSFYIPNQSHSMAQKELWLQYTYSTVDGIGPASSVLDPAANAFFSLVGSTSTDLGGGLYHQLDIYSYNECPQNEIVSIFPGSFQSPAWIDQVVIDTRCIPAPSAAGLLICAGLIGTRRRRRA